MSETISLELNEEQQERLRELARRNNIDTSYWDFGGTYHEVAIPTLVSVLASLDIVICVPEDIEKYHLLLDERPWRQTLPPCLVVRQDMATNFPIHLPHGLSLQAWIETDGGQRVQLRQVDHYVEPRQIDSQLVGRATFEVPAGLELGWHQLYAQIEDFTPVHTPIAVTPARLESKFSQRRAWGVMAQLYSAPSTNSWGIGDFSDLALLATIMAQRGADFLLINPIHAAQPWIPLTPSPYLPVTRIFINPIYIRPEDIYEYAYLSAGYMEDVRRLGQLARLQQQALDEDQLIDRDQCWRHKREALEIIFASPRSAVREAAFNTFKDSWDKQLDDFALWCAIAEGVGQSPWPPDLQVYGSSQCEKVRQDLSERIEFYKWLQWIAFEQLQAAQTASKAAGMRIGIMNDLAVGVHPRGSEVWSNPQAFARNIGVGAPPDMYNPAGQNWSQPPLRPDYLEQNAYLALRQVLRSALRGAGALRIDHILGLFRLWWIPAGGSANEGTYVRYNHEAMVGVLLLEAYLADAVLIGEDLGTVEPWVRDYLSSRGVYGTSVFWFENNEDGSLRSPESYRRSCLATVNTHDLPPTLGYLEGCNLVEQDRLDIAGAPLDSLLTRLHENIIATAQQLRSRDLLDSEDAENFDPTELVCAMHRYIGASTAELLGVSLVDMVGDKRMQNLPGTDSEYPNWKIPLSDSRGRRIMLEDLASYPLVEKLSQILNNGS